MTKQDIRLRNRRVKRQALLLQKRLLASINNRILKPLIRDIKKEDNLDQNGLIELLNSAFINSEIDYVANKNRFSRNSRDIKAYSQNYLREINKVYEKEKKRQADKA